ncbi:MAG: M23 family metallopeptidase [Rubrivivax sp.]|nr:M23 family metallopeptidase [Rubrivivax sp.]
MPVRSDRPRFPAAWLPLPRLARAALALAVALGLAGVVADPAQAAAPKKARAQAKASKAPARSVPAKGGKPKVVVLRSAAQAPADVPRQPASTFRQGCMPSEALQSLTQALVEASQSLRPDAAAGPAGCVPYASVALSDGRSELLAVLPPADGAARRALLIERNPADPQPAARWHELEAAMPEHREVWSTVGALSDPAAAWTNGVPAALRRELNILVRQMRLHTDGDDTAQLRVLVEGDGDSARLLAVELLDAQGARSLETAVWVPRTDGPGAFVSALGVDYERALWQSPVDHRRISRGVGMGTVFIRQRVLAPAGASRAKARTVVRNFVRKGQHIGIDFAAPTGTPVVAVADGTVSFAGWRGGYGNLLIIDHGAGLSTYYGHLSATEPGVAEGTSVRRGTPIGQVGATGWATGPHLHFEVRKDGRYMDPADPDQQLAPWVLQRQEHERFLTRLLLLAQPGTLPEPAGGPSMLAELPAPRSAPMALPVSLRPAAH